MPDEPSISDDATVAQTVIETLPWWGKLFGPIVPSHSASEKRQYNWRLRIALVSCFGFFASVYMLAAYNQIPYTDPIVRSSQLQKHLVEEDTRNTKQDEERKEMRLEMREQWAAQLDAQIMQFRKDQCRLQRAGNPEAASQLFDRIRERILKYFKLTGEQYSLPDCVDM